MRWTPFSHFWCHFSVMFRQQKPAWKGPILFILIYMGGPNATNFNSNWTLKWRSKTTFTSKWHSSYNLTCKLTREISHDNRHLKVITLLYKWLFSILVRLFDGTFAYKKCRICSRVSKRELVFGPGRTRDDYVNFNEYCNFSSCAAIKIAANYFCVLIEYSFNFQCDWILRT